MSRRKEKLSLGAFLLFTGHHVAAWRSPQASDSQSLADFVQFARIAEEAKFDAAAYSPYKTNAATNTRPM